MTTKTQAIRAPSSLSRVDKAAFRRIAEQVSGAELSVTASQVDMICDLVAARSRIRALTDMLDREVAERSTFDSAKARIMALNGQINATTTLAHRIAARLGLVGDAKA